VAYAKAVRPRTMNVSC